MTKKDRIDFEIADLEEQYKTLQFEVNDAEWTLKNVPPKMEKLKAQIEALEKLKEDEP